MGNGRLIASANSVLRRSSPVPRAKRLPLHVVWPVSSTTGFVSVLRLSQDESPRCSIIFIFGEMRISKHKIPKTHWQMPVARKSKYILTLAPGTQRVDQLILRSLFDCGKRSFRDLRSQAGALEREQPEQRIRDDRRRQEHSLPSHSWWGG